MKKNPDNRSRRRLIKALAGGTVAGGVILPARWTRPVLDTVLLPAHGQTSPAGACSVPCSFLVRLSWNVEFSDVSVDLDLELVTPGGTRVAPKPANGTGQGQCVVHDGDAQPGGFSAGSEEVIPITPALVSSGRYQIFVRNNSVTDQTFRISATACSAQGSCFNNVSGGALIDAGSVNISTGGTAAVNLVCPAGP